MRAVGVSTVSQQLNAEMASVVDNVKHAMVQIRSGMGGAGAGTIWHADGLIVTNAHVVQRFPLSVTLADGRTLPARLLASDATCDLAALVVDASDLPTIELGDTRHVQPGQWVLALGHPWGVRSAVTAGVVIGLGTEWPHPVPYGRDWIAVNLPSRPGNSGGPLIDVRGRLVGINTMTTGPDVALAVPVRTAKTFLRRSVGP